ncbi:sacsin-like [Ruditapes philippinarum]|uniref:sacsin-like n=1 Tax=Ruditapes philippinarum TaxID=129788 RepID=UPI00295B6288|nr:sacsin-like [Ruditapes philippinarum]
MPQEMTEYESSHSRKRLFGRYTDEEVKNTASPAKKYKYNTSGERLTTTKRKKGIQFSSMQQPPLIKQLKGILSEYPDNDQIIKELIQNAEDAGATVVKILHDKRRINLVSEQRGTAPDYTKFFKGPALCVYNDTVFTDKDWEGIQMIYSSEKEKDPKTVGRFGLGFKSVFHMTDHPCVISGTRVLLIDPQQPTEKVNATLDLCDLDEYEEDGFDVETFWLALENTFCFRKQTLQNDEGFKGTLFWFPLREKPTRLSETLYSETKVENLLNLFKSDASNVLVFLKSIEQISLNKRDESRKISETFQLKIEDKNGSVRLSRQAFKDRIQNQNISSECPDIHSTIHLVIYMLSGDKEERQEWLVVNYFVNESASAGFRKLIQDKNLGYSPYVGVATPLKEIEDDFEGHVFCFLPLPKEGERLTGLPVHVNGFFALSQNRHHMKWETEEQEGKPIDDKSILWNKALIEEALPKAYELLVLEIIEVSKKNSNDKISIRAVYNTLPTCKSSPRKTHKRWMELENKLYEYLDKREMVYAMHTREWIGLRKAFFATFRTLSSSEGDVSLQESVVRCFQKISVQYVDVPFSLFDTLQAHFPYIKDQTPKTLCFQLKQQQQYKELTGMDKMNILVYLLKNEDTFAHLQDLELLPLASDKWVEFRKGSQPVYLCSDAEVKMFPGQENRIVMESSKLGPQLTEFIEKICNSEIYQIQRLDVKLAKMLLTETIRFHFASNENIRWTKTSSLPSQWLEHLWRVLVKKDMVKYFKDIPLVPILIQGSWTDPDVIELVRLSDFIIIKEIEHTKECSLNDGLVKCLKALNVKVLPSLPEWIQFESIQNFVKRPTKEEIIYLFGEVYNKIGENAVFKLNQAFEIDGQIRKVLIQFASSLVCLEPELVEMFRKLHLFRAVRSLKDEGQYSSVVKVKKVIPGNINFPVGVDLPFLCIKVDTEDQHLIKLLDMDIVTLEALILSTIKKLQVSKSNDQVTTFMTFFLVNFKLFENKSSICNYAAKLPFLTMGTMLHVPSDLFDPSCSLLQRLLIGESLFPERSIEFSGRELEALRRLGLKSKENINGSIMLKVANSLKLWMGDAQKSDDLSKKADAFMEVLVDNPSLLDHYCNGSTTLGNALMSIQCIPVVQTPPENYPNGMPWFSKNVKLCKPGEAKHSKLSLFAGATVPIVDCSSQKVIKYFKWEEYPSLEIVLNQLAYIRQHYKVNYKPDYVKATQQIYNYLHESKGKYLILHDKLKDENILWTGNSFVKPSSVIITNREGDLDLKPYFYYVPEEFYNMNELFLQLGCNLEQNNELLLTTLQDIKFKHESAETINTSSLSNDTDIALRILKCLARKQNDGSFNVEESKMLMLVESPLSERLSLQPVSVCILDEDQDELDEEEEKSLYIVNRIVPAIVAKDLGVKSMKRKTIIGATEEFGVEEWGVHESLTTRIRTLLEDGYTDGLSVPKELVQNADDSGATIVKFLYDERKNDDAKRTEKLLSSDLRFCQGPALWVFNDSLFTEKDLQNITKLNGATKAESKDKIGKFGLGFCSVYNLTDVPCFISGKDMIIFDPHETYLDEARQSRGTGLRVRLSKQNIIRRNVDQFKPYKSVFGCDLPDKIFTGYSGTLFRLPLRTDSQAARSEICSKPYSKDEVVILLKQLIENAGNILLFTQNVKVLQIYYLPENATDPSQAKLLFSVEKTTTCTQYSNGTDAMPAQSVLKRMPAVLENDGNFTEIHNVEISQKLYESVLLKLQSIEHLGSSATNWIVSWALGTKGSLMLSKRMSKEGAVPLSAIAIPLTNKTDNCPLVLKDVPIGFYRVGHLFCFLPLPVQTDLHMHINGCFSVRSDRRGLAWFSEDDKRSRDGITWNQALMEDSVVQSFVNLLSYLSERNPKGYIYHSLWPLSGCIDVKAFLHSFYKKLISDNIKLFKGEHVWVSFDEVVYLDPAIRHTKMIGDIAFDFLGSVPISTGKHIIEMPGQILSLLQNWNPERNSFFKKSMVDEEELMIHLLNSIDSVFWHNKLPQRNQMLLHAMQCKSKKVIQKLQATKCIPTEPNNVLHRPNELVCPKSEIAGMFNVTDEKFPLKSEGFCTSKTLAKLNTLGMNNKYLTQAMLLQRCKTIHQLITDCGNCALERSVQIIKYCGRLDVIQELQNDIAFIRELRQTLLMPVLHSPPNWRFTWKADKLDDVSNSYCTDHSKQKENSVRFGKPTCLFRESLSTCIGSVGLFVHENLLRRKCALPENLFELLGVEKQPSLELLLQQLNHLSDEYRCPEQQLRSLDKISKAVYEGLERLIVDKSEIEILEMECFQKIGDKPLIIMGKELVCSSKIAFQVKSECIPELYCLREFDYKKKKVFKALGVKDHFTVEFLLSVLQRIYTDCLYRKCIDIDTVSCLLVNLCESMKIENIHYSDLKETEAIIVAPDVDGFLRPTHELVIEDPAYKSSASLHILHGNIPPDTGRALGVKSKQRKIVECFSTGFFEPFGQNESLITRLTGILEDYPCDSSIMKELLQNADDASATEIFFIKNYVTYDNEKIFGKEDLQGPSLCVFNNSYFTEDDFNGIRNLGVGSKREDPSKTGQYGIGFNAVYHLTDTPSFLTKGPGLGKDGQICIFDPMLSCLEGHATSENPGIKCDAYFMKESFPNMLLGYPVIPSIEASGQGTIFRLPLRRYRSPISSNVMTPDKMDKVIESFKKDMFESLLFLKNIKCIKVFNVSNGDLFEEFSVERKLSEEDDICRKKYFSSIKEVAKGNLHVPHQNLCMQPIETFYKINIEDNTGHNENWLIVNSFGIEQTCEKKSSVMLALKAKAIGLTPVTAIALPWPENETHTSLPATDKMRKIMEKKITGKAFCFLPLPITTGLPFHVNGHFALDKARTKLWSEGDRKSWNDFVLAELLSRTCITALQYLKENFVCRHSTEIFDKILIAQTLERYHEYFPKWEKSSDNNWKLFVSNFYKIVIEEEVNIFPSTGRTYIDNSQPEENTHEIGLDWVSLSKSDDDFDGTFNVVSKHVTFSHPIFTDKDAHSVLYTLRTIGMKVIETPHWVSKSISQSGIKYIPSCTPKSVIKFLKTFDDENAAHCRIGKMNSRLEETMISNVEALQSLLNYIIRDENFTDKIDGLPLCLANNGLLKAFSKHAPLFCSDMCDILIGSADQFVHSEIIYMVNRNEYHTSKVIKTFEVDNLLSILADTFDPADFASGMCVDWNKDAGVPIKPNIIERILFFIYSKSVKINNTTMHESLDENLFQRNICMFNDWSFLPTFHYVGSAKVFQLVPFCNSNRLYNKSYLPQHDTLNKVAKKLNVPCLDESCFLKPDKRIASHLRRMLPSYERPVQLLECLSYYRPKFQMSKITHDECVSVLNLFDGAIDQMKKNCDALTLQNMFKKLPLFVSHQKEIVSIDNFVHVIVLLTGIPSDGINDWAQNTGILLLKDTEKLRNLYKFLNFPTKSVIEVYIEKILPTFDLVPRSVWKVHIEYIKNTLLMRSLGQKFDHHQLNVIQQLKAIPFIHVIGKDKRVDQLYDCCHPVFSCMLSEDYFLPKEYRGHEWREFLEILGMIMKPTEKMLIDFAQSLEAKINNRINEETKKQSGALVDCLFNGDWSEQTLAKMKNIRFVVPRKVDEKRTFLAKQPGNAELLICFAGAVSDKHMDLCWSSQNLIFYLPFSENMRMFLGIYEYPPMDRIVQHCQNVTEVFKRELEKNNISSLPFFVKSQMELLYSAFQKSYEESMQQKFKVTPIVFHPEDNKMLLVRQVVVNLNEVDEIRPYLYKLPNCFGPYENLFQKLGSHRVPLCSDYSAVLAEIKQQYKEKPLPYNTLLFVQKALENIIKLIDMEKEPLQNVAQVFIPDRNKVLVPSKKLTVSNNNEIEKRLEGKIDIDFFIGFKELKIDCVRDPALPFEQWPKLLQPDVLTREIVEEISTDNIQEEDCIEAQRIEYSLRSAPVVEGIIRLVKHQFKCDGESFHYSIENAIMQRLRSVKVTKVSGLKTFLKYKGQKIEGTELNASCFIKSFENDTADEVNFTGYELCFQKEAGEQTLTDLINDNHGLLTLVDLCTENRLGKRMTICLSQILRLLENSSEISRRLDNLQIDAYDLPASWNVSIFPRPGTYVEEKFHAFLEQSISPFKVYEYMYVALEVEDSTDLTDPVYMYADIWKENKRFHGASVLDITYDVNVGRKDEIITVPIYRLYRFKPKEQEIVQDLVAYDIEPIGSIPIDENFRRVRQMLEDAWKLDETGRKAVIRRLWMQWHPDRNRDNREYAGRVFNYINEIVLKLEKKEIIDDEITSDTGRMPPDMSRSTFGSASDAVYRRGCTLAAHFHDNRDDYNRSTRTGNFAHHRAEEAIVRHVGEAKRWHRQAVQDYKAAISNITTGADDLSFNWVCYKCHQAAEKALKAAWFAKNANMARRKDHSLGNIANGLDDGLLFTEATSLERITGDYSYMRYPDAVLGRHQIPSEMFDCKKAEKAVEITKCILDTIAELID